MTIPALSLLDLATIEDDDVATSLHHSVRLAQQAEASGYDRVWYAEHHNMRSIASSATAVLIAHIAAHTETIRVGAGGIMLPNHSPLVIAEQFGTLAELHPGRIDLGLGRAPGSDGATFRALRRTHADAENFPNDVLELQAYLGSEIPYARVNAFPGRGTNVPITILGSSLFGASLAAQLGLPYSFASHFAPQAMRAAIGHYRSHYQPSERHPEPYVTAGVNVVAAETDEAADELFARTELNRVRTFLSRGREQELTVEEAEPLMNTPAGMQIRDMLTHTATGGPERVVDELLAFAELADADELITVHAAPSRAEQLASVQIAGDAMRARAALATATATATATE